MPSYVITGASKGLGFEFLRQLSAKEDNTVFGLVRDVKTVEPKVKAEIGERSNLHILHGDLDSYDSLKKASEAVAKVTGGSLDYLIANGGRMGLKSAFVTISDLGQDAASMEEEVMADVKTNVVGNINLFSLFTPLILKGQGKKVLFISSGHGDLDFVNQSEMAGMGPYAIGKAGANIAVAKFNAEFAKDGVLFMSISPGVVDTGTVDTSKLSEKEMKALGQSFGKMQELYPHWKGPISPAESVQMVLSVLDKASLENGDGGSFVSHLGTRQWL